MKSSNNSKKTNIDDISRETQRLVKDSHVRLPYHKPKQKSLKDFLNRQKISTECQASLTGSKKLLQKAWELIESKEQTVEKFYNEESVQEENNEKTSLNNSNIQAENHFSLNDNNFDKEINLNENHNNSLTEFDDDEENYDSNSNVESELSSNDEEIDNNEDGSIDDDDENEAINDDENEEIDNNENEKIDDEDSDEEDNSRQEKQLCSEDDKIEKDTEDEIKRNIVKSFIDDEAELSELDCSSDDEDNLPGLLNESGDEEDRDIEFPKKKKHRLVFLSESSDNDDDDDDIDSKNENNSNTEIKLIPNNLSPLFNDSEAIVSTQQLMGFCSGQFQSQKLDAKEDDEEVDDFEDNFDSEVPIKDTDITANEDDADDDNVSLKLVSAKDFFDDEAELSESDWSSDDEDKLVDLNDKLEEEEGDKDKLDESLVKDGLDKIYMRQLLDDDNQQVTALKEMLLEDGELYSDSNRKRKFQWDNDDQDDVALKKPLFSDNEEDNEDDALSDDEKTEQWRNERFKRESYLSEKNKYSDEEESNEDEESSNILQTSVSVVKKTHIVKYQNGKSKLISKTFNDEKNNESTQLNENNDETDPNSLNLSTNSTDKIETNKIKTNDFVDLQVVNIISSKHNKCIKGSFMKRNGDKLTNALLFVNKKLTNNDGTNPKNYEEKREMKSLSTITATASSNPFAYLMRNDKAHENGGDLMKIEKTDNSINLSKTYTTTSQIRPEESKQIIKLNKSSHSILKQFE
uniref:Claspin n=1 Tax=Schizaphis graminum TaxID=13262 RepID=A0A2S2PHV4_SCHGA